MSSMYIVLPRSHVSAFDDLIVVRWCTLDYTHYDSCYPVYSLSGTPSHCYGLDGWMDVDNDGMI